MPQLFKPRTESIELLMLKYLNTRMTLSDKDKQLYFSLKKGYEGEVMFDSMTEKLQCECIILNDLRLKINNTTFQIDTLMIISETIYFYEVKNYEGDYYYESDRFYKKPNTEFSNPLFQLNRSESLLRQLLHNLGYNIPINSSVVFINPEFTLYQAPQDKPFIFPTQINRYLKKLDMSPSKLNGWHKMLADKLISLHIETYPIKELPSYSYEQLRKGIVCEKCNSFSLLVKGTKCVCTECDHQESVSSAVLRNVKEFMILFPDLKITTNIIHDWCKIVKSKKRIRKILAKNFKMVGKNRWSFYE
jgi:hypothetical protein